MSKTNEILSEQEMREFYGSFYHNGPRVDFDISEVPKNLRRLTSYARFWGISDDLLREQLISDASPQIIANLKNAIQVFDDELDAWLAGDEAENSTPSQAYIAFSAMRMAADYA